VEKTELHVSHLNFHKTSNEMMEMLAIMSLENRGRIESMTKSMDAQSRALANMETTFKASANSIDTAVGQLEIAHHEHEQRLKALEDINPSLQEAWSSGAAQPEPPPCIQVESRQTRPLTVAEGVLQHSIAQERHESLAVSYPFSSYNGESRVGRSAGRLIRSTSQNCASASQL
jgi:hypothetical protein